MPAPAVATFVLCLAATFILILREIPGLPIIIREWADTRTFHLHLLPFRRRISWTSDKFRMETIMICLCKQFQVALVKKRRTILRRMQTKRNNQLSLLLRLRQPISKTRRLMGKEQMWQRTPHPRNVLKPTRTIHHNGLPNSSSSTQPCIHRGKVNQVIRQHHRRTILPIHHLSMVRTVIRCPLLGSELLPIHLILCTSTARQPFQGPVLNPKMRLTGNRSALPV